ERFTNIVAALNRAEREFNELKKLPARVAELEKGATAAPTVAPAATQPAAAAATPPTQPKAAPPAQAPTTTIAAAPPKVEPAPPPALLGPAHVTPRIEPTAPKPIPPRPTAIPATFTVPTAPASSAVHAPEHVQRRSSEIEEKLGTNWLNKIGIAALVIGIALFLAYKFPTLSNPEKVGLGYFVSFAILGLGVYMERIDLYRIFARALIGGGWALVFFTTYAMHFVKYTRVIDTQWVDLVLLFAVAWLMVAHTLRYNSQVVTGLAFLLGYTTVAISQNTVYCLAAGAILAIGLVAIIQRRSWFELEVFGLIASYVNHYIWLRSVIEPMGAHKHMFPEFVPSAILLCLYWAIYRWSYIARRIQRDAQEHVSTLAALLNTSLLLLLLKYQSVRPELAFYVLLALGAVELTLGQLPITRVRRMAVVILSSIGVVLLVAAIPFKYSGTDMAVIWLVETQFLFLAGVLTREALFRRFGMLAALLTAGEMLIAQAEPVWETRLAISSLLQAPEHQVAVTFAFAGLLFYVNAHWIPRRWKDLIQSEFEQICFRGLTYLAGLMVFVCLWLAFPGAWTAVAWASAATALCVLGRALDSDDLSHGAHFFGLSAFFWALDVNRVAAAPYMNTGLTLRLVTLSVVIVLSYLCARWAGPAKAGYSRVLSYIYTTAAAILFVVVTYCECHWAWIGIAWGVAALILAALGIFFKRGDLSYQAHALALAGFARTLVENIDATQEYHHFTLRFITFTLMTALLYACAYFSGPRDTQAARVFSMFHTSAGSILIAVLAYKEVSSSWIAVTWAAFAL
ncbi:MAG TPA: DUF2339 domain-containing protein, partial [Candidatus Bathyarchaeia archaeon]|nr:DUF2339 domain-containing protein [Candidatus Bathyarchaeia archaeon]